MLFNNQQVTQRVTVLYFGLCDSVNNYCAKIAVYTTINFTRLSVTMEMGALSAAGWAWSTQATVSSARGRCTESRPELETVNK